MSLAIRLLYRIQRKYLAHKTPSIISTWRIVSELLSIATLFEDLANLLLRMRGIKGDMALSIKD